MANKLEFNIWIEKTLVKNRKDRIEGNYKLGKRLWSPTESKNGADIYKNMRKVRAGDLILHFTDNKHFSGISYAAGSYYEGKGVPGSEWEGDAYIVELKNFEHIKPINREKVLNKKYQDKLDKIRREHDVFYTKYLNLRQGAYLTECPLELFKIIDSEYYSMTNKHILKNIGDLHTDFDLSIFFTSIDRSNLIITKELIDRFCSSVLSKNFLILTGLSGSGKTKLAQAFAKWISNNSNQINLVPVGADWTNREPLLGYPNALVDGKYVLPESGVLQLLLNAQKDPENPYFLILDEMNLSHVERYFADFLSAIESDDEIKLHSGNTDWPAEGYDVPPKLSIPKNLFIIGTVNIDETTYMFSPKVLDRANVIEFRVSKDELETFLNNPSDVDLEQLTGKGASIGSDFVQLANARAAAYSDNDKLTSELLKFFEELTKTGAEFGYRTANEIVRFASVYEQLIEDSAFDEIMDAAIVQKLLPKLHGSRRKLEKTLFKLGDLCLDSEEESACKELFKDHDSIMDALKKAPKYRVSFDKIIRMHKGLIENGFTSFAEA